VQEGPQRRWSRSGRRLGEAPVRRRPPCSAPGGGGVVVLGLSYSSSLGCGGRKAKRVRVARVLAAAARVLKGGGSRVCGAGSGAEGGDARRPCHGHAAAIERLQRGLGLGSAGGRGGGKVERARAVAAAVAERGQGGARLSGDARGAGPRPGEKGEKGARAVRGSCRDAGAAATRDGASGSRERGRREEGES
jgi:hypothetical protein